MPAEDFGHFVAELRRQRTFFNEANILKTWTQDYLGQRAGLSKKQISDIEVGKFANWASFFDKVNRLAKAFGLNEDEKAVFYAKAGFVYETMPQQVDKDRLRSFLEGIPYPTIVRNPIWDFIAFNGLHITTWNFTVDALRELDQCSVGANNLWMVFDDHFLPQTSVKHDLFYQQVIETFRMHSFPYIHTQRYKNLITGLHEGSSIFRRMWALYQSTGETPDNELATPRHTSSKILNHKMGELEFFSMRFSSIYIPDTLLVTVYMPRNDETEEKLRHIRNMVKRNQVHFFREFELK